MNIVPIIIQVYIIIWSLMYLTRNVPLFLYTHKCNPVYTAHGSAINVEFKLGLSPLHNRVYGDIICMDGGTRLDKQKLPVSYCPSTSAGSSRAAMVELIDSICKPVPSEPIELVFDSTVCPICLETTGSQDAMDDLGDHVSAELEIPLIPLKCGHSFHGKCITQWRQIRNNCPLCNAEIN